MSKADADRQRRLAQALRQNLRRRKEQTRGGEEAPPPEVEAEHDDPGVRSG